MDDVVFSLDNLELDVLNSALLPDELTETQQSDKTTRFGKGLPRSDFANLDDNGISV